MTRGWIRASLGIMASALAGLACALADDAGQAVCSGSFSGKGCGTCVGCEPPGLCAADGSCVICDFSKASGADNGGNGRECVTVKATPRATAVTPYTYSSERAAFGVVRLNCKGLLVSTTPPSR